MRAGRDLFTLLRRVPIADSTWSPIHCCSVVTPNARAAELRRRAHDQYLSIGAPLHAVLWGILSVIPGLEPYTYNLTHPAETGLFIATLVGLPDLWVRPTLMPNPLGRSRAG